MTIYKDVNGREFVYNECWNRIYLDEKRPHIDHIIRHKWPEENPKLTGWYLVECMNGNAWYEVVYWRYGCFFIDQRCLRKAFNEAITHWWNLPEVTK